MIVPSGKAVEEAERQGQAADEDDYSAVKFSVKRFAAVVICIGFLGVGAVCALLNRKKRGRNLGGRGGEFRGGLGGGYDYKDM